MARGRRRRRVALTPAPRDAYINERTSAETIMGLLVDGAWKEDVPRAKDGHFVRPATAFHNYITPDGSPGASGKGGFPPKPAATTSTSRWPVRGRPAP